MPANHRAVPFQILLRSRILAETALAENDMPRSLRLIAALALATLPLPALAQDPVLAVVAPRQGPFAALGGQVMAGAARLAQERKLQLVDIAESCETGSGEAISAQIIRAKAFAAIGFLCGESLDGAGEPLKTAGIFAISLSIRSKILFEDAAKEGWPLFSLAATFEQQADGLTAAILGRWQAAPFAILEDGTLPSRELADAVRTRLEDKGMKPVFYDTIRPGQENQISLARRLAKAGATHALFTGDRGDAAILARDAAAEGIELDLLGGESLNAADLSAPLADGVSAVLVPEIPTEATELAARLKADGILVEGYVLPAYVAAGIAADALQAAARDGATPAAAVAAHTFDTPLGPIAFDEGKPRGNRYTLTIWRDGAFQPAR